ncbi:MAG: dehydratase [Leptospiraceae bacterium]|nr:dehydratase [Leptospiraceae bacterium]
MGAKIEFDKYEVGGELPELVVGPITHADLVRYAGASGDFNPIHNDKDFAVANGLEGTIAHGMYVMAQIGRLCSNWADQKQMKFFGVKFKAMTPLGTTLTCKGKVKKKKEDNGEKLITVAVEAVDQNGEVKAGGDLIISC